MYLKYCSWQTTTTPASYDQEYSLIIMLGFTQSADDPHDHAYLAQCGLFSTRFAEYKFMLSVIEQELAGTHILLQCEIKLAACSCTACDRLLRASQTIIGIWVTGRLRLSKLTATKLVYKSYTGT